MRENFELGDWVEFNNTRGINYGQVVKLAKKTMQVDVVQHRGFTARYRIDIARVSKLERCPAHLV